MNSPLFVAQGRFGFVFDLISYNISNMTKIEAFANDALALNDQERAQLASRLLSSLPAVLHDDDDGLSEALRRDRELTESSASGISWEELKKNLGR